MDNTLESLIGTLHKRLQDEEFDSALLTTFLNNSLNEILGEDKYPFMQRIDRYDGESRGEINLPIGYGQTFYLYAQKPGEPRQELKFVSPEEYFENTRSHSYCWTKFANTIFYAVHKDPDANGFIITHLYLENPRPLAKPTDRPPLPPEYTEALILGALSRAEETRDNFDFAQLYRNQQDQLLTNMKLRYGPGNLTAQNTAKLPFGGHYYDTH